MADHEIAAGGSSDDVARLIALTERQQELWILLREAEDEETRNKVFDELTANRQEIADLKEKASAGGDDLPRVATSGPSRNVEQKARSVGEQLRAQIITQPERVAPPQPPPPPPPPPIEIGVSTAASPPPEDSVEDAELVVVEPELPDPAGSELPVAEPALPEDSVEDAEPVVVEPELPDPAGSELPVAEPAPPDLPAEPPVPDVPQAEPEPPPTEPQERSREVAPSRLAPEPTPYRSRADDLAALRRELAAKEKRGPKVSDEVLEKRRRAAHDRYQSVSRVRPQRSRVFPVIAIAIAIGAIAVAVWYSFFFDRLPGDAPPAVIVTTTTTTTTTAAPALPPADIVASIQEAVDALDVGTIGVTEQVGTIVLSGFVDTEPERQSVIDAAQGLAGSKPVDTSRLELTPTDEEIRAAVEQVLGSDSFSEIGVAASNGIAILTGVVDAENRAELIGAVAAVDGVARVVDAARTRNVAAELAAAVRRIGGPDPIVYASGQLDLTAEQQGTLDDIAEAILALPGPYVTLVGYTDPAGGAEENRQISQVRADLVRNYLVTQGVPAARLVADGRGEDVPAGVVLPAGLERRIEFEIGYGAPPGVAADFRIGIVAPSVRNDGAFTQSIVQAADLIAAEGESVGIDIAEGTSEAAAASALRSYAASGFDLVIAHGAGYGEAVGAVAAEYPDVAFVWGPGSETFDLPNVSAYDVAAHEGAYVMGAIAASLTDSGVVGVVGSSESGESQLFAEGFAAGAAATDADIEVLTVYTGSTSDVTLGATAATAHIEAGADVLTGTDAMATGAIEVTAANNAAWFGNQTDQAALAVDRVVASQVYHWEVALREIVSGLTEGALGGREYMLTLSNGGLAIAYNPNYELALDTIVAADTIISEIISGALSLDG